MYVIMDMEWVQSAGKVSCPVQLAALRVNDEWTRLDSFNTLIRPRDDSCRPWTQVGYGGIARESYLSAPSVFTAFRSFFDWLRHDDVLLWWNYNNADVYRTLLRRLFKMEPAHDMRLLDRAVRDKCRMKRGMYELMKAAGVPMAGRKHVSKDDCENLRALLLVTGIDPEQLEYAPATKEERKKREPIEFKYYYDSNAKLLHKAGGCEIPFGRGYTSLADCVKKGLKPCPVCMKEEHAAEERKLALSIINKPTYNFIYASDSLVFHTAECRHAKRLPYNKIMGAAKYSTCLRNGRRPCQVCAPEPDYIKPSTASSDPAKKNPYILPGLTRCLDSDETRAYKRYLAASRARERLAQEGEMSADQRKLSSPVYAFWAARGYKNFHLANCPKLNGLTQIKGFALYSEAVKSGYSPCRCCRPSKKHGLLKSVPNFSSLRPDETPALLDHLCGEYGYAHSRDGECYRIATPAGKWKLNLSQRPIILWHINLVKGSNDVYHRQPRTILSLSDAFWYIQRHDDSLLKRQAEAADIDEMLRRVSDELNGTYGI